MFFAHLIICLKANSFLKFEIRFDFMYLFKLCIKFSVKNSSLWSFKIFILPLIRSVISMHLWPLEYGAETWLL